MRNLGSDPDNQFAKLIIKLLVTVGMMLIAASAINLELLKRYFHTSLLLPSVAAVLILTLLSSLHTIRWNAILGVITGRRFPFGIVSRVVLSSYFFGQIVPISVGGDAMRVWWTRRQDVDLSTAFNAVILDRVTALVGIAALMTLTAPLMLQMVTSQAAAWGLALAVGGIYCGLAFLCLAPQVLARGRKLLVIEKLVGLGVDARSVIAAPLVLLATVGASALVQACVALIFFLLAVGMGVALDPLQCLVLIPPVILISALPITVAGWGLREGAMIVALDFVGIPSEAALALSVIFGLVSLSVGLIGGLIWMASK